LLQEYEMERSSEGVLTPKARRTRERILEAALGLFADRGYEATTMRDVAREAGASLGLAYRYFVSKEEFALALYMRLAEESEAWARDELSGGTVAERFEAAMLAKLDQVSPHRGPLAALLARALDPNSRLSGKAPPRYARRWAASSWRSCGALATPLERSRQGSWGTSSTHCTWPSCCTGSTTGRRMHVPLESL
jgi:AcrR family transcriptional regulator